MALHIKAAVHTTGTIRAYKTGVAADRESARDRNITIVKKKLTGVVTAGSSSDVVELQPSVDFHLMYCDGQAYEFEPVSGGWARAQRLPQARQRGQPLRC